MSASLFTNLPEELRLNVEYIKSRCYYWPTSGDVIYKPQDFGPNPTPRQKQWNVRFANKKAGHLNNNETQELAYKAYCAKSTELHKEFGCAD